MLADLLALDRPVLADTLARVGADGWLLFDFHGCNPVAGRFLPGGMATRRTFVWVPREGEITAIIHRIELGPWGDFPGRVIPFARHAELHEALRATLGGKRAAMEVSPRNAVPYLDRIPHGVVELLQSLGVRVVPSGDLVTRFAATWSAEERAAHGRAAEALRTIALEALARAVRTTDGSLTESALQGEVVAAMRAAGLHLTTLPIVGFGPNAANPHYEPEAGHDRALGPDEVVLLDLWGGEHPGAVFADQTWMGFSGPVVPPEVQVVWETVRSARDAALTALGDAMAAGGTVPGYLGDRAARGVIEAAGYGAHFVHRTGHSIDRDLHGSGPHLDDYETHDNRSLLPGTGFSVEPGIYLPGRFGVRSEVNGFWGPAGLEVTPGEMQVELVVGGEP